MNNYYQDPYIQIIQGDCREVLAELPAESVQCVITSPPYWGLRKYAGELGLIWSGDKNCEHEWGKQLVAMQSGGTNTTFADKKDWDLGERSQGQFCAYCGAWKGSYGLEPTPEMYIEHTIEILREIKRVLRKDGVVFWNIGDSYNTTMGTTSYTGINEHGSGDLRTIRKPLKHPTLKQKDLCLIPFRVAIAAQEDGWWVRSIIIWDKPNPMPESADDRPTKSHEYILMLTKSAQYYWDADAVREPLTDITLLEAKYPYGGQSGDGWQEAGAQDASGTKRRISQAVADGKLTGRNIRSVWEFPTESSGLEMCLKCKTVYESGVYQRLPSNVIGRGQPGRMGRGGNDPDLGNRNFMPIKEARDRPLESPIHPYRGDGWGEQAIEGRDTPLKVKVCHCGASNWLSHFAAFPEKLPETCIKAATKPNDLVLDPLAGSGRVGKVAKDLGRKAILIDTSEDYCRLAKRRIEVVPLPMIFPVEETYPKAPDWF